MAIQLGQFDAFEFQGVDGRFHTLYGCSIVGVFEFEERLAELSRLMRESSDEQTVESLYCENRRFRFLCNRCLRLNGIKPKWVSFAMLEQLLFVREEGGQPRSGYLVELNRPKVSGKPGKTASLADLIAGLYSYSEDLQSALELAQTEPARQLLQVMEAIAENQKTGQEKNNEDFKGWAERMRSRRMIGDKTNV